MSNENFIPRDAITNNTNTENGEIMGVPEKPNQNEAHDDLILPDFKPTSSRNEYIEPIGNVPTEIPNTPESETNTGAKKERSRKERMSRYLKGATISIIGLLALRGGDEVAQDISRAKDFIEQSGYNISDYLSDIKNPYSDILYYGENQIVRIMEPATIDDIVLNRYGLEGKNAQEAKTYIDDLNKNNPNIYRNNIGEIGPDSQVIAPDKIEAKSPLRALAEYAFGDSSNQIDTKPSTPEESDEFDPKKVEVANAAGFPSELTDYTIQAGDSLWGIANRLCQEAGIQSDQVSMDTIVGYIKNINNLSSDDIKAGDNLRVPPELPESFKIINDTTPIEESQTN